LTIVVVGSVKLNRMPLITVDISTNPTDIEIKLNGVPEHIRAFVAQMVSSRYVARTNSFVAHVSEFPAFKEYLDSQGILDRDASEEAMDRVIGWTKLSDLDFQVKSGDFNGDLAPESLKSLKTELFSDQVTGVRFLTSRHRSLLADSMGIGKTLQSIASFSVWKSQGLANRALVVSISAVKYGWGKEIKKHSNFSYTILPNGKKNILDAIEAYKKKPTDFLIVHYEGLAFKRDPKKKFGPDPKSEVVEALCTCPFDVLFVDEAHLLKNMDTIRFKSLASLLVGMQTSIPEMAEIEVETENGARTRRLVASGKFGVGDEIQIL
jgi:hypothetical protein